MRSEDSSWNTILVRLEQVRAKTLAELGRRDDQWLEEQTSFGNGQKIDNYFKWFHVIGHEINHRGRFAGCGVVPP